MALRLGIVLEFLRLHHLLHVGDVLIDLRYLFIAPELTAQDARILLAIHNAHFGIDALPLEGAIHTVDECLLLVLGVEVGRALDRHVAGVGKLGLQCS